MIGVALATRRAAAALAEGGFGLANQRGCGQVGAGNATMGGDGDAGKMDPGAVADESARLCESSLVSPMESGWKRQVNMPISRTDPFPG